MSEQHHTRLLRGAASMPMRIFPERLAKLGFEMVNVSPSGAACIVPPVCLVPAGEFLMGSDPADPGAYDPETGQAYPEIGPYRVPVGAYAIGRYPVTVAEYALAVLAGAVPEPSAAHLGDLPWIAPTWRGKTMTWEIQQHQHADHPVVCVPWQSVRDYCRWLAEMTDQPWRLPTEMEWEKAARWDTSRTPPHARIYPWGDQWENARANTAAGGQGMTTPIGTYANNGDASPYGCHDMAGNVWEYSSTIWHDQPLDDPVPPENASASYRVMRGGSWGSEPQDVRVARRSIVEWHFRDADIGFRIAQDRHS